MTLKVLDFETGPEGAALTGNAQGGNSGASTIVTNAGTAVFSKTLVRAGSLGARFNSVANALCIGRFTTTASNTTLSANATLTVTSTPNIILGIWSLRGTGVAGRVNWNPDNSLSFVDATLSNTVTIATGLTPGTPYELSLRAKSATATTGTITAVLYSATGTELGRASSSTYNLGTTALSAVDVGVLNTNAAANSLAIDYLQLDDGNTAELRAPVTATNYQANLPLTADGTVAASSTAVGSSALPLTSSATLAQTATNAATAAQALTAAGTLAQASTAALTGSQALTGTGALATGATVQQQATNAQATTGSLDMATTATRTAALALNSAGTLTLDSRVTHTARLDLTATSAVQIDSTHATVASLELTAAGALNITSAGTDHYDVLDLVADGQLTITYQGAQRDITVTAVIAPRTRAATVSPRTYAAAQQPRRWDAHADVPA